MKRFSKMFAMFIIFVGLVVILSCSNQVQDISSDITYDFSSDGEPIDVIILAGQSNATGCCFSEDLRGYVSPEDFELFTKGFENQKIIWYIDGSDFNLDSALGEFTNVKFGQGVGEEYFGPEIGMSYVLNKANKNVILLKYTSPGSYINKFLRKTNIHSYALNFSFEAFMVQSLKEIVNRGYSPSIKGICWMQGESDSISYKSSMAYEIKEKDLIEDIKNKFGRDIIFIDAKVTDWDLVLPSCYQYIVNEAKINISMNEKQSFMISSENLTKKKDDVAHYDARSQFELGKRFGEMILSKCY